MIRENCRYLAGCVRKVLFDAEHFFDGYRNNPSYAMLTILAAEQAGAVLLVIGRPIEEGLSVEEAEQEMRKWNRD